MGIELAKAAAVRGGKLTGNEHKVLMYMALVALDRPNSKGQPPNLYFAGWEPLALALGYDVPSAESDDPADLKRRAKYRQLVSRAWQGLERRGFIERLHIEKGDRPRMGVQQTVRLTLSTPKPGMQQHPHNGEPMHPQNGEPMHPQNRVDSTPRQGVPRKKQELTEDLSEDESHLRSVPIGEISPTSPHHFIDGRRYPDECVCTLPRRHVNHALSLIRLEDVNAL